MVGTGCGSDDDEEAKIRKKMLDEMERIKTAESLRNDGNGREARDGREVGDGRGHG